jgi:hypothetical protein
MIGMARATPNSKPYFILPRSRGKVKRKNAFYSKKFF